MVVQPPGILCRQVRYFNSLPSGDDRTHQCREWRDAIIKYIFLRIPTVTPSLAAFQFFRISVACPCKGQTRGLEWSLKVISFGFEWELNYISFPCREERKWIREERQLFEMQDAFTGNGRKSIHRGLKCRLVNPFFVYWKWITKMLLKGNKETVPCVCKGC
jgi:hypothetical protein